MVLYYTDEEDEEEWDEEEWDGDEWDDGDEWEEEEEEWDDDVFDDEEWDEEDEERGEEEDGESSELRADNCGGAAADSVGDGSSGGGATEETRPMQQEPPQAASYPPGALVLPIPSDRELLAIEHPCYVVNPDKGLRMLGGLPAVARASVANSDCIECFLRPGDPLSHPLFGLLTPTPGILLKVRRRKRTSPAPAPATDAAAESPQAGDIGQCVDSASTATADVDAGTESAVTAAAAAATGSTSSTAGGGASSSAADAPSSHEAGLRGGVRGLGVGVGIFTGQISKFVSTNSKFRQVNARFGDR